ncbi:hypothetical protein EN828_19575 [Mesorhizobium sp. M2D.F.Ca.ET.185.01.1.1]|uniref:hypothetical protein n=1 Tax=unclassified Mesorhizobium TaxID=325217 RepID=UPI000FD4D50A|nr:MULTISPECIES: hypothetical protein [unclassified Mesorhizobium]TGP79000.1 hypothetical protein EN870_16160 [bacterium M00.F.Ca.ET.227.01.1.1]TGP89471.1 hypothetical protein EN864_20185 [bacterium M00.F.Ca.ET.221.01.1.1]TGP94839.1 hypothetical protein EN865_16055 [bacterium M00.F.Ca.ET.222.01.1.1]TGU28468.1 hypothetical protein EN799_36990 [bacterium M00.F.Ca.ET.156.01.1.1]TGU45828.1 hypothetical protein EN789_17215 [bacterium M00.F.Ca.ET.146.01.1.1]TGV68401.1 hypothetical protein EN803_184
MLVIVFLSFQIARERRAAPASISRIGFVRKPLRTFRSDAASISRIGFVRKPLRTFRSDAASISRIGFVRKPLRTFRSDAIERPEPAASERLRRNFAFVLPAARTFWVAARSRP